MARRGGGGRGGGKGAPPVEHAAVVEDDGVPWGQSKFKQARGNTPLNAIQEGGKRRVGSKVGRHICLGDAQGTLKWRRPKDARESRIVPRCTECKAWSRIDHVDGPLARVVHLLTHRGEEEWV